MLIRVYLEKGRVSDNPESAETVISETRWMSWQLVVVVSSDTPLRLAKLLVVLFVHQVTAFVEDSVEELAVGEDEGLLKSLDTLLVSLALPGVDGHVAGGHGGGGMVLCGEEVVEGPGDFGIQLLMRMAVWTVMWRQPVILVAWRGLEGPYRCWKCLRLGTSLPG